MVPTSIYDFLKTELLSGTYPILASFSDWLQEGINQYEPYKSTDQVDIVDTAMNYPDLFDVYFTRHGYMSDRSFVICKAGLSIPQIYRELELNEYKEYKDLSVSLNEFYYHLFRVDEDGHINPTAIAKELKFPEHMIFNGGWKYSYNLKDEPYKVETYTSIEGKTLYKDQLDEFKLKNELPKDYDQTDWAEFHNKLKIQFGLSDQEAEDLMINYFNIYFKIKSPANESLNEDKQKYLYSYGGPVYRFERLYSEYWEGYTEAVSLKQAIRNLNQQSKKYFGFRPDAKLNIDPDYVLCNDESSEEEFEEKRTCPNCGRLLIPSGECVLCDLGDESVLDESVKLKEANLFSTKTLSKSQLASIIFSWKCLDQVKKYSDLIPNFKEDLSDDITDDICTHLSIFSNQYGSGDSLDSVKHRMFLNDSKGEKVLDDLLSQITDTMSLRTHTSVHNMLRKALSVGLEESDFENLFINNKFKNFFNPRKILNQINDKTQIIRDVLDKTYNKYSSMLNEVKKNISSNAVISSEHLKLQRCREYSVRYFWNELKQQTGKSFEDLVTLIESIAFEISKIFSFEKLDIHKSTYISNTVKEPRECLVISIGEYVGPYDKRNKNMLHSPYDFPRTIIYDLKTGEPVDSKKVKLGDFKKLSESIDLPKPKNAQIPPRNKIKNMPSQYKITPVDVGDKKLETLIKNNIVGVVWRTGKKETISGCIYMEGSNAYYVPFYINDDYLKGNDHSYNDSFDKKKFKSYLEECKKYSIEDSKITYGKRLFYKVDNYIQECLLTDYFNTNILGPYRSKDNPTRLCEDILYSIDTRSNETYGFGSLYNDVSKIRSEANLFKELEKNTIPKAVLALTDKGFQKFVLDNIKDKKSDFYKNVVDIISLYDVLGLTREVKKND